MPSGADIAVVGAGFTGLETVGELAAARPDLTVRLVTSGEVAGWFGPRAAEHLRSGLDRLGVERVSGAAGSRRPRSPGRRASPSTRPAPP